MKELKISKNKIALVDESDYDNLIKYSWGVNDSKTNLYAQSFVYNWDKENNRQTRKIIQMHRLIMNVIDPKIQVDHIDGNGLNNQKSNLRLCTNSENQRNKGIQKNNKSGYKGVWLVKGYPKYRSLIRVDNKKIHLGYFANKIDAAKAYNEAAIKYFGEFAWLNPIPNG